MLPVTASGLVGPYRSANTPNNSAPRGSHSQARYESPDYSLFENMKIPREGIDDKYQYKILVGLQGPAQDGGGSSVEVIAIGGDCWFV